MNDETVPSPYQPGPPHRSDLPDGFRVVRELAGTEMSVVYLAEQVDLGRQVALKVLNPKLASDPRFRERFAREARMAANLRHPNIIPIHAAELDDLCYLVMPYIDGPNLANHLRTSGRLSLPETARILGQVAAALDYAHTRGLIHRDVKPNNILLDSRSDHAYVLDFGIARHESAENLTQSGEFLGTNGYAPPEQIRSEPVDRRVDVYALGCVLFECLTGQPPYLRADVAAILYAHLTEPPPRVSDHRPDLPVALDAVVAKALAKMPAERYATCKELIDELNALVAAPPTKPAVPVKPTGQPAEKPADASAGAPAPPARRRLLLSGIAGLVLVAAAAVLAWALLRSDGAGPDELARLPGYVRGCEQIDADADFAGAATNFTCRDRATGQSVTFGLFDSQAGLDSAYDTVVRESAIKPGSGDCSTATGAEHRYPGVGRPAGRVLCFAQDGITTLVWSNDQTSTLARAQSHDVTDADLIRSWTGWAGIPNFPTKPEQQLLDDIDLTNCRRTPAGNLDSFPGVVAALDCSSADEGARTVSFYRFATTNDLKRTYNAHVGQAGAPSDVYCGDVPDDFLGNSTWVRTGDVVVGSLLCHPYGDGEFMVEWTTEPVRLLATAIGPDPAGLAEWWEQESGPDSDVIVSAMNRQADPPFPTADEETLLNRIPESSRELCLRPAADQIARHIFGDAPVIAVVCGPTGEEEPDELYYYQFDDREAMNATYDDTADGATANCLDNPEDFTGSGTYLGTDGERDGRLACGIDSDWGYYISWTDESSNIQVFAYDDAEEPDNLMEWWRRKEDSGPLP